MSTPVTYNAVQYPIPAYQDTGYAQGAGNLSSYLIALATGSVNVTGNQTAAGIKSFSDGILVGDGTESLPSIANIGNANTGFWWSATNQISLVTAGTARLTVTNSSASIVVPLWQQGGSAANPVYSFTSYQSSGMWNPAADTIGISAGGTNRFSVSTTAVTTTVPVLLPNGSASACALAASADVNTGLVWTSADNISLQAGGGGAAGGEITVGSSGIGVNSNALFPLGINGSVNNDFVCQIANNSSGTSAVGVFSATSGRTTVLMAAFGANYSGSRCGQAAADLAAIEFGGTNPSAAVIVTQTNTALYFGTNQTLALTITTGQVATFVNGIVVSAAGSGMTLKTPDGNHTYSVAIDNNGLLTTTQLT